MGRLTEMFSRLTGRAAKAAGPPIAEPFLAGFRYYKSGYPREMNTSAALAAYHDVVYGCIRPIAARASSCLAYPTYKVGSLAGGSFEPLEDGDHPFYALWARPNALMSGHFFRWLVVAIMKLAGKAPVLCIPMDDSSPIRKAWPLSPIGQLWPLSPDRITLKHDEAGLALFEYSLPNGGLLQFPSSHVLFYREPHPANLFDGWGPTQAAGLVYDVDKYLWELERSLFDTGLFVRWIVTYPEAARITPEEAALLAERFGDKASDKERAAEPLILGGGAEAKEFSSGNDVTGATALAELTERRIRQSFGVPRGITGDVDALPRANIEGGDVIFNRHVIEPLLALLNEENERVLFPLFDPELRGRYDSPVPTDLEYLLRQEDQDLRQKVVTINEVREERGLEPVGWGDLPVGGLADTPYTGEQQEEPAPVPAALAPFAGKQNPPAEEPLGEEEPEGEPRRERSSAETRAQRWRIAEARRAPWEKKLLPIVRAAFARQEKRVLAQLEAKGPRALMTMAGWSRKHAEAYFAGRSAVDDIANLDGEDGNMAEGLKPSLLRIYTDAGKAAAGEFEISFVVDPKDAAKIGAHLAKSMDAVIRTTEAQLKATLREGFLAGEGVDDLAQRVRDVYEGISKGRAQTIARTESLYPANSGAMDGYSQAGVEQKEWIATQDGATREDHLEADGQVVGVADPFDVGGERLAYPGDPAASPENVINCRCTIGPVAGQED